MTDFMLHLQHKLVLSHARLNVRSVFAAARSAGLSFT